MKNIIKKISLYISAAVLICVSGSLNISVSPYAENNGATNGNTPIEKIDAYLTETAITAHIPALSVTIVNKDEFLLSKTYGNAESTDVPFLLGSVSKSFTALSVMQLYEQGKIDLDAYIAHYLPNLRDGDKITVKQLLNHTGGLDTHQTLKNVKVKKERGVHEYANVNYTLLGKIIESVTGTTYENYVKENIFLPLNMNKSAASYAGAIQNGLIQGYRNYFGFNIKSDPKFPKDQNDWISVPAGYLSASTADLGKYLQMYLCGGKNTDGKNIISAESINKMFYDGVYVPESIPYTYGYGWTLINDPLPQPALRHSGLVETGMSCIYILPESGIGIACAINVNDYFVIKDFFDRLDWSIALMLMGENPNVIGKSEYALSHLKYNAIYLGAILLSTLPVLLLLNRKKRHLSRKIEMFLPLAHIAAAVFFLFIPKMFFKTPLWVVKAFVPDLFITVILSSALLVLGGIIKTVSLIKLKKERM